MVADGPRTAIDTVMEAKNGIDVKERGVAEELADLTIETNRWTGLKPVQVLAWV